MPVSFDEMTANRKTETSEEIRERVKKSADELYFAKREKFTPQIMQQIEKAVVLQTLDQLWRDHIVTVEQLRQVIHLRGYGQRDPLNEYKTEGFNLFEAMISKLRETSTAQVMRVEIQTQRPDEMLPDEDDLPMMAAHHIDATSGDDDASEGFPVFGQAMTAVRPKLDPKRPETWGKVSRNDPCPCGSGKKYKHCHGSFA